MKRGNVGLCCVWFAIFASQLPGLQQTVGQPQDDPVIKVESQLVQVFFTVTDGTRRVTNLTSGDFALSEDGAPRDIGHIDTAEAPLYLALLLDTSETMRQSIGTVREEAAAFVRALRPADRVVLVQFNSDIRAVPQLTDDQGPILEAIQGANASGGTKLYDALLWAMKLLNSKPGRKAIVVFSDGEDTMNTSSLEIALNAAARYGFPIFTIGAGKGLESDSLKLILRKIAEVNSGRTYVVDDTRKLDNAFGEVLRELRSAYVLNYYTQVAADGRWHDIKIRASDPRYKVHARSGFYARSGQNRDLFTRVGHNGDRGPGQPGDPDGGDPADAASLQAAQELRKEAAAAPAALTPRKLDLPASPDGGVKGQGLPVFKVETRFVEVPVIVERTGRSAAPLSEKDFRVYENDTLRDIAFFSRGEGVQSLTQLQKQAMSKVGGAGRSVGLSTDPGQLKLGRFFVVLDDMMTEPGSFVRAKVAIEKILREQTTPLRPVSLHLTSHAGAETNATRNLDSMLTELKRAAPRASRELHSNDGIMTVYEAYLIERGDANARMLAELRYAGSIGAAYQNELGTVQGDASVSTEVIRAEVVNVARSLVLENQNQVTRAIEGLRAVVGAAAALPGDFPRTVVLISGGFSLGRGSLRGDVSDQLSRVIDTARRAKVHFYTIDASGLSVDEPLGIRASASFLATNPHLQGLLQQHAREWRLDMQEPLHQLAAETGARFLNSTNDLAEAANRAFRAAGEIYYLGFVSTQAADGRFRSIRVSVSEQGARVFSRNGYFAGQHDPEAQADDSNTDWNQIAARADAARRSGNTAELAENLAKLARRFPGHVALWFNLGTARLELGHAKPAVDALQRAFALAPDDRDVGVALAHALLLAGYRTAAGEALERLVRRQARDIGLLIHLGRVYEASGKPELAYRTYRRLLDLNRQLPLEAYLLLVRTATRLGRTAEAEIFTQDFLACGGGPELIEVQGSSVASAGPAGKEIR